MIESVIVVAALCIGATFATLVLLRVDSGREDRDATLRVGPPTRTAVAARRLTGLYVRVPGAPVDHDAPADRQ